MLDYIVMQIRKISCERAAILTVNLLCVKFLLII